MTGRRQRFSFFPGAAGNFRAAALLGWAFVGAAGLAQAENIRLRIETNRDRIYLGESFILYVHVQGSDDASLRPDLSGLPEAEIRALGSQSKSSRQIRIINNRISQTSSLGRTFVFEITPARPGPFPAGPVRLSVEGQVYNATGKEVHVTGLDGQDHVRIRMRPSREVVYVTEPFSIILDIAIRAMPSPHSDIEPLPPSDPPRLESPVFEIDNRIRGLKSPDMQAILQRNIAGNRRDPGFRINNYTVQSTPFSRPFAFDFDVFDRQQAAKFRFEPTRSKHDGALWWHYRLELDYEAGLENDYVFGPLTFKGGIWTGAHPDNTPRLRNIFAVGPAATVRVVPPPEANRPESFIGAIGETMRIDASLDTQTCQVGDPLLLTLDITGNVSAENMRPPKLSLQTDLLDRFRFYDDSVKSESLPGGKRFLYRLRPIQSGSFELLPIHAAFFDPASDEYKLARSRALPLQVRESEQVALRQGEDDGSVSDEETTHSVQGRGFAELPSGIVTGKLPAPASAGWRALALGWLAGPGFFLAFILSGRWLKRHRGEGGLRARRQTAGKIVRRLKKHPPGGISPTEIQSALVAYFKNGWSINPGEITAQEIGEALQRKGCPAPLARKWRTILEKLSHLTFADAPERASEEINRLRASVIESIFAMEKSIPASKGFSARVLALFFSLAVFTGFYALLASSANRAVSTDDAFARAEVEFLWHRGNAAMARATEPEEFESAIRAYRELAARGVRSAALFYNLGVAAMMTEDGKTATDAFLRAERLGGAIPGLRHNLRLSMALEAGRAVANLPAYRIPLFWHFNFSFSQRLAFLLVCWNLAWIGLSAARRGSPRLAEPVLALALVLFLFSGASVATSWIRENSISYAETGGEP